ncbi:hypothetical protein [Salinarimonas rosea]|uniref:hypothetical protein n=1 Tax=Salinarimonas rosea TaxID=552063 RepID=UPI00040CC247|nr:hypothetical protein [Salinarimonas rosea]
MFGVAAGASGTSLFLTTRPLGCDYFANSILSSTGLAFMLVVAARGATGVISC